MPDSEITALYDVADDGEAAMLDALRRRAGQTWEHVGCWTNVGTDRECERCGTARDALVARNEVLTR